MRLLAFESSCQFHHDERAGEGFGLDLGVLVERDLIFLLDFVGANCTGFLCLVDLSCWLDWHLQGRKLIEDRLVAANVRRQASDRPRRLCQDEVHLQLDIAIIFGNPAVLFLVHQLLHFPFIAFIPDHLPVLAGKRDLQK